MRRSLIGSLFLLVFIPGLAFAHCEVPCGIFDDAARIETLREHTTTIAKAMGQIDELSEAGETNYNQIVRWVMTKEEHAEEFQEIVSQYFLHQRIKPAGVEDAAYVNKLSLLHQMLVSAMRSKQSTDAAHTERLNELIGEFEEAYFSPEDLEHIREHRAHGGR